MAARRPRTQQPHRHRFGQQIRQLREEQGLSQEGLGELAGLHRNYVGGIERGERNVGLDNIYKLATALKVHVSDLFVGKG